MPGLALAEDIFTDHRINLVKQRANLERSNYKKEYRYIEIDSDSIETIDGVKTIEGFSPDDTERRLEIGIKIKGDVSGDKISIGDTELSKQTKGLTTSIRVDGNIYGGDDISIGNITTNSSDLNQLRIDSTININGDIRATDH